MNFYGDCVAMMLNGKKFRVKPVRFLISFLLTAGLMVLTFTAINVAVSGDKVNTVKKMKSCSKVTSTSDNARRANDTSTRRER